MHVMVWIAFRGAMNTFDIISKPELIRPELGFSGLFLTFGLCSFTLAAIVLRRTRHWTSGRQRDIRTAIWVFFVFMLIWTASAIWFLIEDVQHAHNVRYDLSQGKYFTLEGCLESFRAGKAYSGRVEGNEGWVLRGHEFSYGSNQIWFAYHAVEPQGGIVHADSWVRVSFVHDDFLRRDDIVRLEVNEHACPSAPDIAPSPARGG